jgi:hypothetical protein
MVSMPHESLVDLFRNRPTLAPELLDEALGVTLPSFQDARIESVHLNEARPIEYRADLVIALRNNDSTPVLVVIVEVQLGHDPDKRFSWPEYLTGAHARFRCQASLLVVAPDPAIATFCAAPIDIGPPGWVLHPRVLTRATVPVVIDPREASRRPELSVLSAMAHGDSEIGAAIAMAALPALGGLDEERARFYGDLVYSSMNEAARKALEAKMKGYQYQSDFAKKYVAEGKTEGIAGAVLTVLRARGFEVPEAVRDRILACTDLAKLEHWLKQAAVRTALSEILDEPS